jgi:hypothetical protein
VETFGLKIPDECQLSLINEVFEYTFLGHKPSNKKDLKKNCVVRRFAFMLVKWKLLGFKLNLNASHHLYMKLLN